MTMKPTKTTVSHTISEQLKRELERYSAYCYKPQSQIISEAIEMYLGSRKAFQELKRAESERDEFFKCIEEDCDMRNMNILDPDSLCGYKKEE